MRREFRLPVIAEQTSRIALIVSNYLRGYFVGCVLDAPPTPEVALRLHYALKHGLEIFMAAIKVCGLRNTEL